MLRKARISLFAAAALLCSLCPQSGLAAATAQMRVSLVVRQSCEVRTDESREQAPSIQCPKGEAYGLARYTMADVRRSQAVPARAVEPAAGNAGTPEVWVVTF
jgi:hypothetical protein